MTTRGIGKKFSRKVNERKKAKWEEWKENNMEKKTKNNELQGIKRLKI